MPKIKLVKMMGFAEDDQGKYFNPSKKTRGLIKHGYYGDESNTVCCPENHKMKAEVAQELFYKTFNACSAGTTCEECGFEFGEESEFYHCDQCDIEYCTTCARKQLGLTVVDDCEENPIELMPGDILLCWPDWASSHHAVLVTGEMQFEEEMAAYLEVPPGSEVWSMETIESTGLDAGKETWWHPAKSYFVRDRMAKTACLIADEAPGSDELCVCEKPVPVKVILHPLRPEWSGSSVKFDGGKFREASEADARTSKRWSLTTGGVAIYHNIVGCDTMNPQDYPDVESRADLLQKIKASWQKAPICSSVPIKVWQTYFLKTCKTEDEAVQKILKYMPLWCHETTPSQLMAHLTQIGWVASDNFEA